MSDSFGFECKITDVLPLSVCQCWMIAQRMGLGCEGRTFGAGAINSEHATTTIRNVTDGMATYSFYGESNKPCLFLSWSDDRYLL
jgi:hypothetical protein